MRVFLSALFLAAATLVPLAEAQTPDDSNEGSRLEWDAANAIWRFKWWGRQGRTYFIQHSDDLHTWVWLPLVEPGNHAVREWGFTSTGSKFFLRLVYSDQPSSDPENDDFDGDGVSNLAEVMQGTSPLRTADSDGDGLPNDWEIATGLDPQSGSGSNGATGDVDQDGLTNEEEAAVGTNPKVADTDGDGLSDSQDAVPTNAIMKVKAAPEVAYAIVDLGTSSDVGSLRGVNDRGEVLFSKYVNNPSPGKLVAKLWSSGNFYELPEESNRVVALLQDGSVYFVTKSATENTIAGGSTSERRRKIWKRGSPVSDDGPGDFYISKFENDSESRVMPPSSLPGIPEVLQSKVVEALAEAREALSDGGWTLGPAGDGDLSLRYDTQWVNDAHRVGMSALLVCMEWGQGYSPGRESTISAQVYGDDAHAFSGGVTWQGDYYETLTFSTILYVAGASANRANNFRRYSDGSYTYTLQTDSSKQTFINGAEASGCSTLVDAAVTASAEGPYYIGDDGKGEAGLWCDNGGNPAHIKLKGMPAFAGSYGAIERRITRNLVTLGGSMIWRNGRTRSLADLTGMTGENPVWTNLSASLISPENNLIAGTASREGTSHSVLLVPVDIQIKKGVETTVPKGGLVTHKNLSVSIQLSDIPQQYFPAAVEDIKWFSRKLKWDGTYTDWADMGEHARGVKFHHDCDEAGIFQVKCEWTVGTQTITTIFDRDYDDPNTADPAKLKKGDPDSFGVVETTKQEDIRNAAKAHLGSTDYSAAGSLPLWRDPVGLFTGANKCNVFVADVCDEAGAEINPPVAGVYITSPPSANNWSGMPDVSDPSAPYPIPNFTLLPEQTYPQPGFVAASGFETGASGHSGIIDYDGRWISAGSANVNRKAEIKDYKRRYISGAVKAAGQRRYDGN